MSKHAKPLILDHCNHKHTSNEVACDLCALYGICRVAGLESDDLEQLDKVVKRRETVKRGAVLFEEGEPFHAIYAIKSGSFKSSCGSQDKRPRVTAFHFTGELIGLDAIQAGHYTYSVTALEASSVCRLEFDQLEQLGEQLPAFQQELIATLSGQLSQLQITALINQQIANKRLATFLLDLSVRFAEREMPASTFRLSMSRSDIGNYLGLAVETISRLFSQLQEQKVLDVKNRMIEILDPAALRKIAL